MTEMTRQFITIIFLSFTIHLTTLGQQDLGIKANYGLSYLNHEVVFKDSYGLIDKNYYAFSFQGGLFYKLHLHNFSINAEILFMQIGGKEYREVPLVDQYGNIIEVSASRTIWRHISYLGIPIYMGYDFKRLNINFGFQTNLLLLSSEKIKYESHYNGILYTSKDKYHGIGIDKFDYGIKAGLIFRLSDKFFIEANYYYGLNNIYKGNNVIMNIQQMTIGLRYKFNSFGGNKDGRKEITTYHSVQYI
jgi:opacity protein-like surface antigen